MSELVTNAIQHARPVVPFDTASIASAGPGTIVLRLWPTDRGIVLSVSDRDPRPPTPRAGDDSATGGRGLLLTEAMANRWGYCPTQLHKGKIVWAEVPSRTSVVPSQPGSGSQENTPLLIGRVLMGLCASSSP
ncbi:hypothetical protein JCM13580A_36250 [Streptomyces drozdowiczii]